MDGPPLDVERLKELIDNDEVDTVLVVFPDLQGRLMGKRVTGRYFRDHVLDGSIEACNYLLAVDVDMTPLPGYRFANWEQGYGDFSAVPDLATLRSGGFLAADTDDVDPWGTPFSWSCRPEPVVVSIGPDRAAGTLDDVIVPRVQDSAP